MNEKASIEAEFPLLKNSKAYSITSDTTFVYNCLAWAIGDTARWWDTPRRCAGYYWHPGAPNEYTLASWQKIFKDHGYVACKGEALESGYEKVAIYMASGDEPTHVARQVPSGRWTSKLGQSHDIEHASLSLLEGTAYGKVVSIMKRVRKDWQSHGK